MAMDIPSNRLVTNGSILTDTVLNGNARGPAGEPTLPQKPKANTPEPIAICGIGLRLPGGIRNGDDFWDLLIHGKDARSEIPVSRFAIDGFDTSLSGQGAIPTRHGYFLDDDLSRLDTSFFSLSKNEIERCDPQQRLLLEVVRETFEDAGEVNYRGQSIGCYVGTFGQDWYEMTTKDVQSMGNYSMMGSGDLVLANRVSYEFDLRGPSLVVKTGCSASLVALHDACRALQSGDTAAAIVCGTSLIMTPTTTAVFFNEGVLSPDASCKTFDAAANGFARAEGITAVYIKRLDDALRDGNPIRAVIRNTGSNNDGRSQGLTSPNGEAHETLMRQVYQQAHLDPSETAFVECHGTGTPVGDPTEARAVGNVFGNNGVYIGSVKPNVGHSEGSSGLTSLIKAVLALEHRTIPPNIKFQKPNPQIPFSEKKLVVPLKPTAFPKGRVERISVNSFGIGGSNAHAIIDSSSQYLHTFYPAINGVNGVNGPGLNTASRPDLLLFSANSPPSLRRQIRSFEEYTAEHSDNSDDAAYTLALHREHLPHRAFAIVQGGQVCETSTQMKATGSAPKITMVFSGQGAQWPRMGRGLILTSASFRADIIRMDKTLQRLRIPPGWSILDELLKSEESSQIHRAELAQPLSTALQIALVRHLERLNITPAAVVGHSSGEIAAAYASGYISLEYAITLAYYRGYVSSHGNAAFSGGAMAAVGLGAADVSRFLQPGVCVACENSPSSTTISGDAKAVPIVLASILAEYPETPARTLKVDVAYHSHHMAALSAEYLDLLHGEDHLSSDSDQKEPGVVFFSSVTTKPIRNGTPLASPYYWVINLVSPVRFSGAMSNLLAHHSEVNSSKNVLLEIGPHSALAGPLRQICEAASQPCKYIPSQIRGKDSTVSFLSALGSLYQESVLVNWKPLFPPNSKTVAGLPAYPWDHSAGPFWYESRLSKAWRTRRFPQHCLLGTRVVETPDTAPQWRNVLNLENVPWLGDHKVREDVVFPFAAYVAIAGEAVRQMTGSELGYRLRHVVARTALVLTDTEPVEMVTALRQQKLTDTDDSTWFDFVIASYSGPTWVKHCEGQATALLQPSSPNLMARADRLPRLVTNTRFYDAVLRAGLVFGPEFQRLAGISTSTTEGIAQAKLLDAGMEKTRPFPGPLHPASIDACIQLLLLANVRGLVRNLHQLVVPTLIENIEIAHGSAVMNTKAVIPAQGLGSASVECVTADNRVALRMSGLQVTALDNDHNGLITHHDPIDNHAAARLHWLPDFDFAPLTELIKPPASNQTERELNETLTLLCILESASQLAPLGAPAQPHHTKYLAWLNQQLAQAQSNTHPLIPNTTRYTTLPPAARRTLLEETYTQLLALPGFHAGARGLKRISDHAAELFTGERDTLDLLMQDELLAEIYNADAFDYGAFVRLLAHARPDLRVLEVGAGTGGTTELLLRGFRQLPGARGGDKEEGGLPGYAEYMFTDVSAGFFPQARERFAWAPNMQFQALDISRDAAEQGFVAGSYDLVVAPNVVHATPCLRETLANLRPLLKDDGMLLLLELSTVMRMPTFIFGNFSGWWLGEEDGRIWEPYILPERWDKELKAAGFTGVDSVVADGEMPWQMSVVMVSKPKPEDKTEPERKVTVLCQDPVDGPAESLISELRSEGWGVTPCYLGELPPAGQDIISCVDLETRFFDQGFLTETNFAAFQELVRHLKDKDSRILWLTPPFQVKCRDPRGAQVLGVMRTIRAELGLPLFTLELDYEREADHAARLISEVFIKKVQNSQDGDILNADREFAIDNGTILLSRYHPFSITSEQTPSPDHTTTTTATFTSPPSSTSHQTTPETTTTLRIPHPGHLPSLTWTTTPLPTQPPTPLPPDHVLIQIHSAALNFRDILLATGAIPAPLSGPTQLGYEASGTVLRTGTTPSAARFRPGDRVLLLSPHSTLTTALALPAALVARIPDAMPLAAAAAAPVCFGTAMHALLGVGRLRPGMSVLVHSACGGVGLAALEVCRMVGGVEVFVTVGSAEKVEWLVGSSGRGEGWGVKRERVFGSRDGGFVEGVMRETGGRGVDLVLNSLSGELLHASWGCVAKYGMLLELGKRDLVGAGRLDMAPFLANRTYAGVDLFQYLTERPDKVTELLAQYVEMYEQGRLRLPHPISSFAADEVEQAFRHLQNAGHIGKVVVNMPNDPASINSVPLTRSVTLDPEATYLLIGGAKGLGASLSSWLVEHGARNLTFLSRSSGTTPESKALLEELRAMGCSVNAVVGSVENKEDILAAVLSSGKAIRGVFQLAMVMNDAPLLDMKWHQWNATVGPKVRGTWNLHDVLADQPLDFFWMASSMVTVVDEAGQSNYSAGCIFLEAFCQYRHSLGLPATVLNICPIGGVGYVAENAHARRSIKAQGLYTLGEHEFLDFVQHNILAAGPKSNIKPGAETGSLPAASALQSWENPSQVVMGLRSTSDLHLDDPNSRTNWRRDRRMGRYHNIRPDEEHRASSSGANRLALFLDSIVGSDGESGRNRLADPEVVAYLAREIGEKIYELILKPIADGEEVDTRLTLAQIGLDSLMAIELRRWLRRVFGIVISVLEIMGSGSLIQLGGVVGGKLAEKLAKEEVKG